MDYIENSIFLIALTFIIYWGAKWLQGRLNSVILNPVLVTIVLIIAFLKLTGLTYDTYAKSGHMIEFWLKPAIVALGVPLYSQLRAIRRQFMPILVSQLAGGVTGVVSVVLLAKFLGASNDVIISLAPKSVTSPIAIEITSQLGGIPALTGAIVVCVGLIGAIAGMKILYLSHISSPIAQGISMGTAAHVIGTSRITQLGERYGAYATVGLILNGVLTALLAQPLLRLLGIL